MKKTALAFAFALSAGIASGSFAQNSSGLKVTDDIAGTPHQRATGDLTAKPKEKKEGLFPECNSSDCNIESYTTDCNVVHGGLSSEPGGGISCNAGPQHKP